LAHESILGGHLGTKKTYDKILSSFHWPGIDGDVTRFCRSCEVCQKTVPKGSVKKVPLKKVPLIDVPFKRVVVDLVGKIFPTTEKGKRYILTMVDSATRYPDAIALKSITAEEVAEGLVSMFCRLGVPNEILSDQGTQFMSDVMKEVNRLLSIKHLTSTVYHPTTQGLCEKFNGTLKRILKRLCEKSPKQWDRYLDAALFAYREVPQESTGFSPFELLYGRIVRGPMQVLKELWTKENVEETVKTSYQYVVDLREKLETGIALAHENLSKAHDRYKRDYDKKAKVRRFKVGDFVLVLLPTDSNKLLMQWQGPFRVEAIVGKNDYKVNIRGREKMYHINLLKKYFYREDVLAGKGNDATQIGASVMQLVGSAVIESNEASESDIIDDEGLLNLDYVCHQKENYNDNCCEELRQDIDKMLQMGVIERAESPYAAPPVIVKKPDGTNRICIDYRKINRVTLFDSEPTPVPSDIFVKIAKAQYVSTIDLSKGYWQIPMAVEDIPKTGFVTPEGAFVFRRMPFGLKNSSATFNKMMRIMIAGLDGVDSYIDDIIVYSETWEDHLQILDKLFGRINEVNLHVRPSKCVLGARKVDFLGHHLGDGEIGLQQFNISKIKSAPRPLCKKEVRSFLGLTGFYRNYIQNYSSIAAPLTDATKKNAPNKVVWGEEQEVAYNKLKECLMKSPVLRLPDMSKDFVLRTDASDVGVGAVLMQDHEGELFPIAYASKKFLGREKNYSVIERECLALVWAILKFSVYLYGRSFILQTDHQPLVYLDKSRFVNARIMRWALFLQSYSFRIESIKGSLNVGADCMSRVL
jgi:hypothetical protein